MNANARARANIARPGKRQTLTGLDPYHRLLRETQEQPSLPYAAAQASFSVPRPSLPPSTGPEEPLSASTNAIGDLSSSIDDEIFSEDSPRLRMPLKAATTATLRRVDVPQPVTVNRPPSQYSSQREKGDIADTRLSWRPLFLYRRILIALAALFFLLIVIIEVLLAVSNRRIGLFNATSASRHLWQYGSALVGVVLVGIWARVEFQAKASAPWIRLSKGFARAEQSLLLDYLSMTQPQAIWRAYQNGDVIVVGSTVISMLLLGLVFVAATLVTPFTIPTMVPNAPVTLRSAFVDDSSALGGIGNWPYVSMLELQTTNLGPPAGVSTQFAFQTFDSPFRSPTLLNTTVDGFTSGLTCQPASVTLTGLQKVNSTQVFMNVTVSTPECRTKQGLSLIQTIVPGQDNLPKQVLALQAGSCGGSFSLDDQRIVVLSGSLRVDPGAVEALQPPSAKALVGISLTSAMAMMCQPNYTITNLRVVRNQTDLLSEPSIEANGAGNRVLPNVHPWEIAEAHFASYENRPSGPGFFGVTSQLYFGQSVIDMDEPTAAVIATHMKRSGETPRLSGLQDPQIMMEMVQEYFRQYFALIAASGLTESASVPSTAAAIIMRQRLIMRALSTHFAAAMLGLCGIGALILTLYVPKRGFLPRDPGSIAGAASLLANSSGLLQTLRGTGGLDMVTIEERLEQKVYYVDVQDMDPNNRSAIPSFRIRGGKGASHQPYIYGTKSSTPWEKPLLLRWLIRLMAGFVIIALIIVLEAGLQASKQGNGFALVSDRMTGNQYLIWTLLPIFIMLPLSEYLLLTDFYTRATAPFLRLLGGADFDESLGLKLLDMPRFLALRKALLTRNYFVALTALGALFSPVLLVISTGLVTTLPVDMWRNVSTAEAMPIMKVAVRQDVISTRILEGLLGILLIVLFLSWYASKDTGNLPRPTTSIASVAAYLVDGNLLDVLPNDAEWLSLSQIEESLRKGYAVMYADLTWETTMQTRRGGWDRAVELFGIRLTRWGGVNMQVPYAPLQG